MDINTNIRAKKIIFKNNDIENDTFKVNPKYYKKITKKDNYIYILELSVEIINTEDNPFPIDLIIDFESKFVFTENDDERDILNYLNIGAIQMIFPFIRSAVNSTITSALLPPLILPIINVTDFIERK